jgi:hypothetical protein
MLYFTGKKQPVFHNPPFPTHREDQRTWNPWADQPRSIWGQHALDH